jgi:hypothetical protein
VQSSGLSLTGGSRRVAPMRRQPGRTEPHQLRANRDRPSPSPAWRPPRPRTAVWLLNPARSRPRRPDGGGVPATSSSSTAAAGWPRSPPSQRHPPGHDGRFAFSREHADWELLEKKGRMKALYTSPLFPGSRYYDAQLKRQGAILRERLPLCDDVALQCGASCVIHLRHRVRQRRALHVLPEKLLRCRET